MTRLGVKKLLTGSASDLMTRQSCDRAFGRPDGWNSGMSTLGENKLSPGASMDIPGSAKQSELFDG